MCFRRDFAFAKCEPFFDACVLIKAQRGYSQEMQLLGMGGKVRFLAWVKELGPVLARWRVFVLPSLEEAFPMAALEATAAGLPVVATAVSGIPEIVEDGRTGWLVPLRDPVVRVTKQRELLPDPERMRHGSCRVNSRPG